MIKRKILVEITKEELEKFEKFDGGLSAFSTEELINEIIKRTEPNNKKYRSNVDTIKYKSVNTISGTIFNKIEEKSLNIEFNYDLIIIG